MVGMSVATAALREVPRMEELAAVARQRARASGRPVLVSVTIPVQVPDPLAIFARGATHNRFFWSVPSANLALAGLGQAWSFEASGPRRFAAADAAWRELMADAVVGADPALPFAGPVAAAGFRFDPSRPASGAWPGFSDGLLLLPRLVLARQDDQAALTLNGMVGAETSTLHLAAAAARRLRQILSAPLRLREPRVDLQLSDALAGERWRAIVAEAVAELRAGAMEKVVLARAVRLAGRPLDIPAALDSLRRDYPDCFVFAVAHGERTFLGASPERLVGLRHGAVAASGLAGSTARGATPEEDLRLGAELLASPKERGEHAVVVRIIREALAGACTEVSAPAEPTLMRMRNVQHLFTPVTGRIAGGRSVLDLVERLHPTPAVGGQPREQALAWIREHEQLDRGWYAGPVGWIDQRGEGEFAVAIRSALAGRDEATLFAGCGIVPGSDPEREYHESQLKLRPMRSALGG